MKKITLNTIKKEFWAIYSACRDLSQDDILNRADDVFRPYSERLNRLAAVDVDDHNAKELLSEPDFEAVIQHISGLKRIHGLRMEIEWARSLIAAPDPWAVVTRFIYYPNYLQLAEMESTGARLKPGDRVVFLGSGPLPLSLIALGSQHGIKGIGLEQMPEYAELSRKVIASLELTAQIQIILGNHLALPLPQECSLVMVGADAMPKDEIFDHLAKTLADGTKLSYRIYEKGLRRLLDNQSVFNLPPDFREYNRIRPKPPVNNTSVFVVKDTGNHPSAHRARSDS